MSQVRVPFWLAARMGLTPPGVNAELPRVYPSVFGDPNIPLPQYRGVPMPRSDANYPVGTYQRDLFSFAAGIGPRPLVPPKLVLASHRLTVIGDDDDTESEPDAEPQNVAAAAPRAVSNACCPADLCRPDCPKKRKVVSQVFGRNRRATRSLPDHAWLFWCRIRYQRRLYRARNEGNWHVLQMQQVRDQLDHFETTGTIRSFDVTLDGETTALANDAGRWENFLLPLRGQARSYDDVRAILDLIDAQFNNAAFQAKDKKEKAFPGVIFVPNL